MAKKQTRRSVSVEAKLYAELEAFSTANDIPIAQIVAQGARAILDGRLPLEPERRKEPVIRPGRRHWRQAPTVVWGPKPPDVRPLPGFCAECHGKLDTRMERMPLGRNDGLVDIYYDCLTKDAAPRSVSLGGGARAGMASGCSWRQARGGGR